MSTAKYLAVLMGLIAVSLIHSTGLRAETGDERGAKEVSSKEDYQMHFCMKYEDARNYVDVEMLLEDMEASPYPGSLKEFWTTPACSASLRTDTKVPIIFNTAGNAPKNENFPKVVHDYFVEEKNSPQVWLKAINTKSTSVGFTFLDYLHYNLQRGYYDSVKASKDAALRIVDYICQNGGVYSKYKDSAKCP